jgi:hypothetical protein
MSAGYEFEHYEITAGQVQASVYGDHIVSSACSSGSATNAFYSSSGNVDYDYGRKLAAIVSNYASKTASSALALTLVIAVPMHLPPPTSTTLITIHQIRHVPAILSLPPFGGGWRC